MRYMTGVVGLLLVVGALSYSGLDNAFAGILDLFTPAKKEIVHLIINESMAAQVPLDLSLAVAEKESGFNTKARLYEKHLKTASFGIFQILLPTARSLDFTGHPHELYKPEVNIPLGVEYLSRCVERFGPYNDRGIGCCYQAGLAATLNYCEKTARPKFLIQIKNYVLDLSAKRQKWKARIGPYLRENMRDWNDVAEFNSFLASKN